MLLSQLLQVRISGPLTKSFESVIEQMAEVYKGMYRPTDVPDQLASDSTTLAQAFNWSLSTANMSWRYGVSVNTESPWAFMQTFIVGLVLHHPGQMPELSQCALAMNLNLCMTQGTWLILTQP